MYEFSKVWRCISGFKGDPCQHNTGHPEVTDGRNTLQMARSLEMCSVVVERSFSHLDLAWR
jgi:hypothetical protein